MPPSGEGRGDGAGVAHHRSSVMQSEVRRLGRERWLDSFLGRIHVTEAGMPTILPRLFPPSLQSFGNSEDSRRHVVGTPKLEKKLKAQIPLCSTAFGCPRNSSAAVGPRMQD